MFVDCPDELVGYDGRNSDNREPAVIPETQPRMEEKDDKQETHFLESDSRGQVDDLMEELEHLRATLEKTVSEKESLSREHEEEREAFVKERLQTEATFRELQSNLFSKDEEIGYLHAKISELSEFSKAQHGEDQYIEAIASRLLASLATAVHQEELLDGSVIAKISHVEKSSSLLIEKYNLFLSEIELLRQCLTQERSDLSLQDEFQLIFVAARDELLGFKRKEVDLAQKISHLEAENMKLVKQIDKYKEMANAEIGKLKVELEQEKTRCANTKEKLSMAVTKGKALVQQRDALKYSLTEKTSEVEKCLIELHEKSSALQAAELSMVNSENLATSLQETLSQRDAVIEKCEEILSEIGVPEELQSVNIIERIRWLVDESNVLKGVSVEFNKLKDVLSLIDSQENVSSSNLESRIVWLVESFSRTQVEANKLQDEFTVTIEAAHEDVDRLTTSLLAEIQEKCYLQEELEGLKHKYEEIIEKGRKVSLEKDHMVNMLLEASGITMDSQDEVYQPPSDMAILIDRCLAKVKEQSHVSVESSSSVEAEIFERIQSLLYVRDQDLILYELILEEMMDRSEVNNLSNELRVVSEELQALKVEKDSLQKDFVRAEDKSALLRDKLSLAVKKGKGLVQERENMKQLLDGKNAEIEKLKLELQQQGSAFGDCRDQLDKLSSDVECIPRLESDIVAMKEQRDQLEQFLVESNNMLQRVIESIEGIVLPVDSIFEEPVEKVQWIAQYLIECEVAKTRAEQELGKIELETNSLADKLTGAYTTMKSLEDALSVAENNISQLAIEKKELEAGKASAQQELQKTMEEASSQAVKFADVSATRKSLEDALSLAENNISVLINEKEEAQISRAASEKELEKMKEEVSFKTSELAEAYGTIKSLEAAQQELQKAMEEASSQAAKFAAVSATRQSLEDALSLAENNISVLINEKEDAQISRAGSEKELEKVKEEVSFKTSKLAEAYRTIKSLEDALSQVETNVSLLAEENNNVQVGRNILEIEIKKLREEADSQASKLADAYSTNKSLEDALLKAEINISELVREKKNAEQEISTLESRLDACIEELTGTRGSVESRSLELSGHVNSLQLFLKDDTLLILLRQSFERTSASLKNMDLLLKDLKDHFVEMGLEVLPNHEEDSFVSKLISAGLDDIGKFEMDNGVVDAADGDDIPSYFRKAVDGFHLRNRILADKVEGFSTTLDELIVALLTKLQATRDKVINTFKHMKSLNEKVKNMELDRHEQENTIAMLENDITILLSACSNATQDLENETQNHPLELSSASELEKLNQCSITEVRKVVGDAVAEHQQSPNRSKYVQTAEKLLFSATKVRAIIKQFENTRNVSANATEDLQNNLKETRKTLENAIDERAVIQNRVSELENDVEALQNSCSEMRLKLESYEAIEDKLKEREAELSSLYNSSLMKEQEAEGPVLSASQVKSLFDKISGIEIPFAEFRSDPEPCDSANVKKLFYIIDTIAPLHKKVNVLSHDKEELQSDLAKQILEIEHLKEKCEEQNKNDEDYKMMKSELFELALGLENIIQKLGGNELVVDQKSAGARELLPVLEKLVTAIVLESENSKSKAQELGAKLLGNQKVVDDLSTKVKLLEDSSQGRFVSPETLQERSIFEAPSLPPRSEISEIEDVGPIGKKAISPAASAAHVRTLRKGSSDHLALNIDSESDRLINSEETDEDKGHVFKSLNTSGLIPRQGKMVADRIDGIWVSGGRALMSRPVARLGLIAYWLLLHMWLLGTIL
ncbi:trans-Golgi network-localized SYP41-interacting protein 1 isoform X2 [Cornus florida]|nr:trans-Golgi network-localized SYP41-interacting protein 1 isoform X2 [Cornus florida]